MQLSSAKPAPGSLLDVSIRQRIPADAKGQHAVGVGLFDPMGREQLWGRHVVLLQNGAGYVRILVAYNDTSGKWRLRDAAFYSNQSSEATWTVAGDAAIGAAGLLAGVEGRAREAALPSMHAWG